MASAEALLSALVVGLRLITAEVHRGTQGAHIAQIPTQPWSHEAQKTLLILRALICEIEVGIGVGVVAAFRAVAKCRNVGETCYRVGTDTVDGNWRFPCRGLQSTGATS